MGCFFLVLLSTLLALQHVTPIDTVPELNITQYLGRWYQVYGNMVADTYTNADLGCRCLTADYGALPNGSITVFNACQLDTRGGRRISIGGYAYRPVEAEKGKLEVVFAGLPQRDDGRNYWVVQLGPPTFNGSQYEYAVVTDSCRLTLFVLARNVTEFKMIYDDGVRAKLREQGFIKFYNRPTEIYQGSDCVYPAEPHYD